MSHLRNCPRCGAAHPAEIAGGMCPRCLLSGLLEAVPDAAPRAGESEGDAVGPYELLEILGEGGMGCVWRARQLHPVEREVALKIIRLGMDTRELVSRFESERQSLAMMDHPGIARVYEAGATDSGRPYFAMELVEGEPVTDYCVSRSLPVEQRLRLFLGICAAVEHAHRKGVIHRDLKPSNVMVVEAAEGARVKVIDFGIAKLLERENDGRTYATKAGHAVGTPGYMSPEQAGAEPDIDTRSDVYSLGALLYEILTGSPPLGKETFREVAYAEVMRLIRETDPPRPSTRLGPATEVGTAPPLRIARDLDRIVMKALARERERRYGGAAALGDDVQRFLNHEPVIATDPTPIYRAAKFVRKYRLAVAFTAVLALGLLTSLVLISGQARRADEAAGSERQARLVALSTLADSYRNAGLAAAEQREDALAALWFNEAAEVAAHDLERSRANRLRAGLHRARAPKLVRMLPPGQWQGARLTFDSTSSFLHLGGPGTHHGFFDIEQGNEIDFGRTLSAGCLIGPAQAAVSSPAGFEIRDLRNGELRESVAVDEPVRLLWGSSDGNLVFVCSDRCRIWNRERKEWHAVPIEASTTPNHVEFSPDGKSFAMIDEEARLWILPTSGDAVGRPPEAAQAHAGSTGGEVLPFFSKDSSQLCVQKDGALEVFDVWTGKTISRNPTGDSATDVTAERDLMTCIKGLWGWSDSTPVFSRYLAHGGFTADESAIFAEATAEFVDLQGKRQGVIPMSGQPFAISPDGNLMAFRYPSSIGVYRLIPEEPFIEVPGPAGGRLVLNDDETLFTSATASWISAARTARVYRIEDGLPAGPETDFGHPVVCATFLTDGRYLAGCRLEPATGQGDHPSDAGPGFLRPWDLSTGLPAGEPLPLPSAPKSIRRSPDDTWIAVLTNDGVVRRVDPGLRSSEEILRLPVESRPESHHRQEGHLVFSEDGSRLYASGFGSRTWAIDLRTRRVLFDTGDREGVACGIHLGDGILLAPVHYSGPQWLFNSRDGSVIPLPDEERGYDPLGSVVHPNDHRVLLSARSRVCVVDWKTGRRVGQPYFPTRTDQVFSDFVPGTPWVITAAAHSSGEESSLVLWDPRTGHRLNPDWPIRDAEVTDMRTTRDGRRTIVCQAGSGHLIILWDEILRHAEWQDGFSLSDRKEFAEIQASRRLVEGTPIYIGGGYEWRPIWQEFHGRQPGQPAIRPQAGDLIRWHRNRVVRYRDSRPTTADWHRARLKELGAADE